MKVIDLFCQHCNKVTKQEHQGPDMMPKYRYKCTECKRANSEP